LPLVLVSKPDCPLCREMEEIVHRVVRDRIPVEIRDVREDPALEARYLFEIPVLLLGEREICRHRTTEDALRKALVAEGLL
jgi:hypothetical protein